MTGLAITITHAGLAALTAAKGSNAITIASVGLTAASFTPTADATTLPGEIKQITTFSGEVADAYTVHLSVRDETTDSYNLRGFGLYLSDGTLFGIYGGGDTLIMEKAAASMLLLAVDLNFSESTATAITFGDTNFINPPATTDVQGVVELATETEAATGTDAKRAVTPKGMLAAVKSWLDARFGEGAPSTFIKGLLASASAAALRTAIEIKSAALEDATAFAAASHKHAIAEVTSLQAALDAKLAAASYTAADVKAKMLTVDGSGSGLDADTLDGYHASSFLVSNSSWGSDYTSNGYSVVFSWNDTASGTFTLLERNGQISPLVDGDYNTGEGGGFYSGSSYGSRVGFYNNGGRAHFDAPIFGASRISVGWDSGENNSVNCSGWFRSVDASGWFNQTYGGGWFMQDPTWVRSYANKNVYTAGQMRADSGFLVGEGGNVWHSNNDGAGSGMDADTVDGWHRDDLRNWNNLINIPGSFPPSAHGHAISDISGLQSAMNGQIPSGNLTDTGYCRLPNGLIFQWGSFAAGSKSYYTLTFPIAFTSACFSVVSAGASEVGNSNAQDNGPLPYAKTATGASFYNAAKATTAWWFAIGV